MAKGKNRKTVTVEVEAVPAPANKVAAVDDWQTRDDASEIMRMGALMRDKSRLKRAEAYITGAMDMMPMRGGKNRIKSNRGRRTAARNIGKR